MTELDYAMEIVEELDMTDRITRDGLKDLPDDVFIKTVDKLEEVLKLKRRNDRLTELIQEIETVGADQFMNKYGLERGDSLLE